MSKIYEVYHCKYKGEVVYVGQGGKGRHKHCNSGVSHVFGLNEVYFKEGCDVLQAEVLHLSNNKEAVLAVEKDYIRKHQPVFNSVFTNHFDRNTKANEGKAVKKRFFKAKYLDELDYDKDVEKYSGLVDEFYNYFGYKSIVNKDVYIYGYKHYKGIGKDKIALLSRYVRLMDKQNLSKSNPYIIFYRALLDIFDIDLKDCLMSSIMNNLKWANGEIKDDF